MFLKHEALQVHAFYDADWVDDPLQVFACSCISSGPISWCSKKQSIVVQSSTEAEYRSFAHTTAELSWLCILLRDYLRVFLRTQSILWCDNIFAI